jgi:thioredoxin reductase (NADPH)
MNQPYDVLIVGAGPCGLSCGIAAQKEGLRYAILDKGSLTESIRRYPHDMTFFSSADMIAIGDVPFTSLNLRPSRVEALKYYRKVSEHFKLNVHIYTEVRDISLQEDIFVLQTNQGEYRAKKVILAIGYYDIPREMGVPGEHLPHVTHYYDEPYKYTFTRTVVVGGANSAIETALDLYRNGSEVTVVHQYDGFDKTAKYWIVPDAENRVKKGEIKAYFNSEVTEITDKDVYVRNIKTGRSEKIPADFVFLMIGYHPDAKFLRRVGITLNGAMLIPEIDPETFESNRSGIYMAGSVIGGEETAKVFIENGKLHAEPIIRHIKQQLAKEEGAYLKKEA